jgi:hypothetical protein
MIVMGDSGGDGRRRVSRRETATVVADRIGQQRWQLNWRRDGNTIAMAIAMNAGGGDGRRRWRWRNLDGLRWLQRNGWRDGGVIVMPMGDGREKATQWKMVMVAAQSRWAMATAVQWTALYLDKLLSPSKLVDRLNVIPWQHGTHDKVWDTTTITSLRKVEVEEELEEKVEV